MKPLFFVQLWNSKVLKSYQYAAFCYSIPIIFICILIIDSWTFNLTGFLFLTLFLISISPCGVIGLGFSIHGLIISRRNKDSINIDNGILALYAGIIYSIGGILGMGIVYMVTN